MEAGMPKLISPLIAALWAAALIGAHPLDAPAQEKAQITDVFKERLAVDDPRVVSVRRYDVPPGWMAPMHQHTGHMFLYVVEGSGTMETEGQTRTAAAGQVIHQLPGKPMVMKNASSSVPLRFILFQIGPEGASLVVPVK
jgi:quercetin dioxygenase-like cupin family protein